MSADRPMERDRPLFNWPSYAIQAEVARRQIDDESNRSTTV